MTLHSFTQSFAWERYSRKLKAKIDHPHNVGLFTPEEANRRGMHHAFGVAGKEDEGTLIKLTWLVDPEDGVIVDARFQVFGSSALIGAAEAACEALVGKNYDQAKRLTPDLIDRQVRDRTDTSAFPWETTPVLYRVIEAIQEASEGCDGIPLAPHYTAPPAPMEIGEVVEGGLPDWATYTDPQKLQIIEQVLNTDVRPYIALDAGGVEVVALSGNEIIIAYQGSCTSCISSVGATLSYIQQTLKNKVHPDLKVTPKL